MKDDPEIEVTNRAAPIGRPLAEAQENNKQVLVGPLLGASWSEPRDEDTQFVAIEIDFERKGDWTRSRVRVHHRAPALHKMMLIGIVGLIFVLILGVAMATHHPEIIRSFIRLLGACL